MVEFNVELTPSETISLMKSQMKLTAKKDDTISMLTCSFNEENADRQHKAEIKEQLSFNKVKDKIEYKYFPAIAGKHSYEWSVNYITGIMHIRVSCECGCNLVKKNKTIRYSETSACAHCKSSKGHLSELTTIA